MLGFPQNTKRERQILMVKTFSARNYDYSGNRSFAHKISIFLTNSTRYNN